jgi:hypothetical protein
MLLDFWRKMLPRLLLYDVGRFSRNVGRLLTHYTPYTVTVGCQKFLDFWKKVQPRLLLYDVRRVSRKFCSLLTEYTVYFLKHNQRDATLYNIIYCCQCATFFQRFFRSSSGAQKLYMQHQVLFKLVRWDRYHGWDGTSDSPMIAVASNKFD